MAERPGPTQGAPERESDAPEVAPEQAEKTAEQSEQAICSFLTTMLVGNIDLTWANKASDTLAKKIAQHNARFANGAAGDDGRVTKIAKAKCVVDKIMARPFIEREESTGRLLYKPPRFEHHRSEALVRQPEQALAAGETRAVRVLESLRKEGEVALYVFLRAFDEAVGRKHHPEVLRKLLLEFDEPITDLETYRRNTRRMFPTLMPALEVLYGALSVNLRIPLKLLMVVVSKFGGALGESAEKAARRLKDARAMYAIKDEDK